MADNLLGEIYKEHQRLLAAIEDSETTTVVPDVRQFIERISEAGAVVADPRQRSQLRALMRFWGSFLYDRIGEFPKVSLMLAAPKIESSPVAEPSKGSARETEEVSPPLLKPGCRFGIYEIFDVIGEGSFSKVYKALDTETERLVALKVIYAEQLEKVERFRQHFIEREKIVGELNHPHIIPIYTIGEEQGVPYIAMKYVESGSLADRLSGWFWRPTIREILNIAFQIVDGLEYLHSRDIVHKDIKPANILIDFDDSVYLTDFGIAQVMESAFQGMIVGTPEYMAPESILHPDRVDGRADVYSLGIVLFELLEGEVPFHEGSPVEIMYQQVTKGLPDLSDDLPESLRKLVLDCLAKDPDDRIDISELREQIKTLLHSLSEETLGSQPAPFITSPDSRKQRHTTTRIPVTGVAKKEAMSVPTPPALSRAPLPQPQLVCPACGASIEPGETFCNTCGTPIGHQEVRSADLHTSVADTQVLDGGPRLVLEGALAILIAKAGLPKNKYYVMERDRVVLGRGQYNDIVIDNPTVSLQHALLVYGKPGEKQSSFTIFDLASANGISVNGEPCVKRKLKHNDVIRLGEVELIFKRLDK